MVPAIWGDVPLIVTLRNPLELRYTSMIDLTNGESCGGYTTKFKYVAGPAFDPSSHFGARLVGFRFTQVSEFEIVVSGTFTER